MHSFLDVEFVEKSADYFSSMLFVVFPLLLLIFYLCLYIFTILITMCFNKPPWVYPAWDSQHFLNLAKYFFSHIREVFSYYLFKYFPRCLLSLSSPSGTPMVQMLVRLMLSQRSVGLSSLFFLSFFYILFYSSDFHHSVLQVT